MTATCVNLTTNFYNLDGVIGERKKHLYKILKDTAGAPDLNNLDNVLQQLQPTNYLETLFKIDVLIFFRRTSELLEILKSGNEIFISKIIKQRWFFKEAFNSINSDVLVNEHLPCMSYAIRLKVLKKLSQTLSEAQMNHVFDSVVKRYGLFIAKNILSSCSSNKIETVLKNEFVKLGPAQLIIIYNKNPTLIEIYFEEYKNNTGNDVKDEKLLKYIALKDPLHYCTLMEKYNIINKLGRCTSKKLIDCKKSDIMKDPKKYLETVRLDTLTRKLQGDYKIVFLKLFPKDIRSETMAHDAMQYLKYFPKKHQYSLFINTFNEVFKSNIWDHPIWLDELLPIFPNTDREKWAELKYKEAHDIKYVKYFPVDKSISLLKEKINLCNSISERIKLMKLLIHSCTEQKNMDMFEDVLKYFCNRHRNETGKVRYELLSSIENNVDFSLLNDIHWSYIDEMITISRLKLFRSDHVKLRTAHIEFLWNNGKPFEKVLLLLFKDMCNTWMFSTNLSVKDPKLRREILLHTIDLIPEIRDDDAGKEEFIVERDAYLLSDIVEFNKENPDMAINVLDRPRIIESIKAIVTKDRYLVSGLMKIALKLLFKEDRTDAENIVIETIEKYYKDPSKIVDFRNAILELFHKTNRSDIENKILKQMWENSIGGNNVRAWLLKYAPCVIVKHFDDFAEHLSYLKIWHCHLIKMYSHINLDTMAVKYCEEKIIDPKYTDKRGVTRLLALVMPPEDYAKVIEEFAPKSETIDLENEEFKTLYYLQCGIAKSLKFTPSPDSMPILFKFFVGDYLYDTISALYSTFYRLPENTISKHFSSFTNKPVSIRKHAVFLACEVLDKQSVINMLKSTGIVEKNLSVQKQLFHSTMKYFLKNPSDDLWALVKVYIKFIDKPDTESMENLANIQDVPRKYRGVYLQAVMELYDLYEQEEAKVKEYKCCIIAKTNQEIILSLPLEFCQKFIQNHFLHIEKMSLNFAVIPFVLNFLFRCDSQEENFKFIFDIVNSRWTINQKKVKNMVYEFFNEFFMSAVKDDTISSTYFSLFSNHLNKLLDPVNSFPEYIFLKLLDIKQHTAEPFIENFASKVVLFQEELTASYGPYINLRKYIETVQEILTKHPNEKYNFCYEMLKFKVSTATCIMAMSFINDMVIPYEQEQKNIYDNIVDILRNVDDPVFKMQYNMFDRLFNQCNH